MSITLKNDRLTVTIEEKGAQMCSVLGRDGTEYIWQADPEIWGRHAPLLFPVIGRLQNGQYTLNGETYEISTHGFARDSLFTVAEHSDTRAVLQLSDSPATRAMWPFAFLLTVTFTLEDNRLTKACTVENRSQETMYYELGSHDGFRAPLAPGETMGDYRVVLPGLETLTPYSLDEKGMLGEKGWKTFPLEGGRVALKPSAYDGLDTVVVDQLPQRTAQLVDREGKVRVQLDFPDFPYLGIWTQEKPFDTNYVCIEPWSALPDGYFMGRSLADKPGIRTLAPGEQETLCYTDTFN